MYKALYASITSRRPDFKNLWRRLEMDELTENVRISCPLEQRVLEEVRMGKQSERTKDFLVSRYAMVGKRAEDLHRELTSLRNGDPEGEYVIQTFKNSRVDEINSWIANNSTRRVEIESLTECPSCARYARNGLKKKSLTLVIGGRVVITDNHGLEDSTLANGVSGVVLAVGQNYLSVRRSLVSRTEILTGNQLELAMAEAMPVHKGRGEYVRWLGDRLGRNGERRLHGAESESERTRIVRDIWYRALEWARQELEMIRESTARKRGGQ
ncbi:hypothetical protein L5515_005496 [Caenorhabditis briggsae]|uniref:Uncharacterized protein n=1 Tax=Caenorhabditis briggsae TaxID=6238 RepID=A0AAE9EKH1_CAEBR|nr:hypothetical protein L5515_005496 [Caenorhabditis briggsae]